MDVLFTRFQNSQTGDWNRSFYITEKQTYTNIIVINLVTQPVTSCIQPKKQN